MESLAEQKAEPKRPLEDAGDSRAQKRCVELFLRFDSSLKPIALTNADRKDEDRANERR